MLRLGARADHRVNTERYRLSVRKRVNRDRKPVGQDMTLRLLAAALLAAASAPVWSQVAPILAPQAELVPVAIETTAGRIVVALDKTHAPVTTANFLHYVDTHRFDGENFYRAMRIGTGGLIQGGVRSDSRKLYPPIKHEGHRRR